MTETDLSICVHMGEFLIRHIEPYLYQYLALSLYNI